MENSNIKKYSYMEPLLQKINKHFITATPRMDIERNNVILDEIINRLLKKMENKDPLFKKIFRNVFYGGNLYRKASSDKPNEYILNFLMMLPDAADPYVKTDNLPGQARIQLRKINDLLASNETREWRELGKLLCNSNYLQSSKVSSWLYRLLHLALRSFPIRYRFRIIKTCFGDFKVIIHRTGPTYTLKVDGKVWGDPVSIDIKLVPSFVLPANNWPSKPFLPNPVQKDCPEFYIIPSKPNENRNFKCSWRLSFEAQEDALLKGLSFLRPAMELIKKLQMKLKIDLVTDYSLKTVFLWESYGSLDLWDNPLSYVFMTMLKKYEKRIRKEMIPYFWNEQNNLLGTRHAALQNLATTIQRIIHDIENHPEDPSVVARQLLKPEEFEFLMQHYNNVL